ncbi:SDR family oxidoreductase [Bradyrhizobium sp. 187]|nr:SDR family oxidoreductase [Bradyrhizobium sp. 187]
MNKVAVVTGGSRGIGRGVAFELAARGYAVIVNYASSRSDADEVVEEIEKNGSRSIAIQGDVGDVETARRLFDAAELEFGGVDVLINNAGVLVVEPISEMTQETFDRVIAINVSGTFRGIKQAASRMRNGGRIVNFSSTALHTSFPGYVAYNASKAAVEAMTKVLAKELAPRRITVNTVAPGPVATELFFDGKSPQKVEDMARLSPFNRLGEVADVVPLVAFLCSPQGSWVSGQSIRVNGALA